MDWPNKLDDDKIHLLKIGVGSITVCGEQMELDANRNGYKTKTTLDRDNVTCSSCKEIMS